MTDKELWQIVAGTLPENTTPYEAGQFLAEMIQDGVAGLCYPVTLDGVIYSNPQEAANGYAQMVLYAEFPPSDDMKQCVRGFLSRFD